MRVCEVPVGTLLVDTTQRLTRQNCAALKAAGIKGVIRYLPELTREEIQDIFAEGLGLMLVAHVRYEGWKPTMSMGASDAEHVGRRAQALGIPMGAMIWCDLEGIGGTADDTVAYGNAWVTMQRTFHFEAGAYVGAGIPLDGAALYKRLLFIAYWKSLSWVPMVDVRGYRMYQLTPEPKDIKRGATIVAGVPVDVNVTQFDHKGSPPTWLVAA